VADGRRSASVRAVVLGACLLVPLVAVVWWQSRPKPDAGTTGPALSDLDVVCLGKVDGLAPLAALDPAVPGRVLRVRVMEGDVVKEGQELLELDDSAFKLQEEQARAALAAADTELSAADLELKQHPTKVKAQALRVAAAGERVAAANRLLDERQKQHSFGTISASELAAFASEVKGVEHLELAEKVVQSELASAEAALKLRVKAATEKKTAADVAVRAAVKAVEDCVLRAPSAGTILRVQTSKGETVAPGTPRPPIHFLPTGPLVVRVDLEQEFLARVATGAKATIRDETRTDSPTWTGRVLSVGKWVGPKPTLVLEPGVLNDVRTVQCVITVDPPAEGLVVGQRMRVHLSRK
jgi:multidrug resistance efflux pump